MLLDVRDLTTTFRTRRGTVRAVDRVSFSIERGTTLGFVGESGCGKSVTALSIMGLVPTPQGQIESGSIALTTKGTTRDLTALGPRSAEMRSIRGNEIAMVFQEPLSSLNPVLPVGHQISEALKLHRGLSKTEARSEVVRLLRDVGIPSPETTRRRFPHQLSGGMRQRVMIAMALSCHPSLLIADEPTTALDVTIQAQVLSIFRSIHEEREAALMFITHDLGVIARIADAVAVMYLGKVVEYAPVAELFAQPLHPYTVGLMDSVPSIAGPRKDRLLPIKGSVPEAGTVHRGCVFAERCAHVMDRCRESMPALVETAPGRTVACFLHADEAEDE